MGIVYVEFIQRCPSAIFINTSCFLPILRHCDVINVVSFFPFLNKSCHRKVLILCLLIVFKGDVEVGGGRGNSLSYLIDIFISKENS